MRLLSLLLLTCSISTGFSLPSGLSNVIRDVPTTKPSFDAKITDSHGMDVTHNFQILLYQEDPQHLQPSNLSDRQVRQSRLINECGPSATFISSRCRFKSGLYGSLQAYDLVCRHTLPPWERQSPYSSIIHRIGHCLPDEICVTGTTQTDLIDHPQMTVTTAFCVAQSLFRDRSSPGAKGQHPGITEAWAGLIQLVGTRTTAVVSEADRQTPTEVDRLEIDAGNNAGAETTQRKRCRDCLDLRTEELMKGTDSLMAEATLLTAGAMAGILWVAVLSG